MHDIVAFRLQIHITLLTVQDGKLLAKDSILQ